MTAVLETDIALEKTALERYVPPAKPSLVGMTRAALAEALGAIGGSNFPMYTQNDGAWVKNAAEEAKMLDTMRKSTDAVVKATSSRGTQTTDTFSLKGIGQAVDRASQECK